jgi:carbonic anhydrase/acetyltransferase-like protein (isoleucine patch superfamily)
MILSLNGKHPRIAEDVFIAPTAVVIGDVEIQDGASIWYGAVLRGDMDFIRVGGGTSIQDNCTVHTDYGHPVRIGACVTVGHNVVVHGATIEDHCLIGLGALILTGALIRTGSLVAAGAVLKEGQEVGPDSLVAGIPARVKRALTEAERGGIQRATQVYLDLSRAHRHLARKGS